MVGRQTPLLALFVPLILVFIVDRKHGIRDTWPAAVVCGVAFAIVQFVAANYISVPLTDILASLLSAGAVVLLLRVWQPAGTYVEEEAEEERIAVGGGSVATAERTGAGDGVTRRRGHGGGTGGSVPAATPRPATAPGTVRATTSRSAPGRAGRALRTSPTAAPRSLARTRRT